MSTAAQLELDLSPIDVPDYSMEMTLAERFAAFHEANPHVAHALELLAGQWLQTNSHVGMKALFERLRWESGIQTVGDAYRLNNSYTAFYTRLLIDRRPEWAEAFHIRVQRAAA